MKGSKVAPYRSLVYGLGGYQSLCITSNLVNVVKKHAFTLTVWKKSKKMNIGTCFVLFDLVLYVPVNGYGHVGTVSLPNHTFFLGKLD